MHRTQTFGSGFKFGYERSTNNEKKEGLETSYKKFNDVQKYSNLNLTEP